MFNILRTETTPSEHEEKTTWLELFFDLIYVAILIEMGNRLSHDLTLQGAISFALLFIPIWMSWLEPMMYSRLFPTDDIGQRLLTIVYMFLLAAMAVEIHGVTNVTATEFIIAYAGTKLVLALMYVRAWHNHVEYRATTANYAILFFLVALFWIVIALVAPTNYILWALAIGLSFVTPFLVPRIRAALKKPALSKPPIKSHYVIDRCGELTIIVLGEFLIKAIGGAADHERYPITVLYAACLLGVSAGLWWLYFDHLEHSSLTKAGSIHRIWIDNHYPLLVGIAAYGVLGTKVLALAPGEQLSDPKRMLLGLSLAVALLGLAVLEWTGRERDEKMARRPQIWARVGGAVVMVALALGGGVLSAPLLVLTIALTIGVEVALDVRGRLGRDVQENPSGGAGATTTAPSH
jgi:low temperature requirement protein LtrA